MVHSLSTNNQSVVSTRNDSNESTRNARSSVTFASLSEPLTPSTGGVAASDAGEDTPQAERSVVSDSTAPAASGTGVVPFTRVHLDTLPASSNPPYEPDDSVDDFSNSEPPYPVVHRPFTHQTIQKDEVCTEDEMYDNEFLSVPDTRFYKRSLGVSDSDDEDKKEVDGRTTMAKHVSEFDEAHTDHDEPTIHIEGQLVEALVVYDEHGRAVQLPLPMQAAHGETTTIKDLAMLHRSVSQRPWLLCAILTLVLASIITISTIVLCSNGQCLNAPSPLATDPRASETATVAPTTIPASSELKRLVYDYLGTISLARQNFTLPLSNDTRTQERVAIETLLDLNYLDLSPDTPSHQFKWQQRFALASLLAHQTSIDSLDSLDGEECDWEGVVCETTDLGPTIGVQNVTVRLDLPASRLYGSIPPDLGLLPSLLFVNLSLNALTGPLPYSIGRWTDIESFSVGGNNLNGTLPASIELWTDLSWFDAGPNYLTGSLPSLIGSAWSNLKHFNVMVNAMNGTLPDTIGLWTNLEYFSIFAGAWWMGTLPDSIGQWTNLQYFDAAWNRFTGTLPDSVGQWTNLTTISLIYNDFTGTLPASIGNWTSIHKAHFQRNNFTGAIPDALCEAETKMLVNVDKDEVECSCCNGT